MSAVRHSGVPDERQAAKTVSMLGRQGVRWRIGLALSGGGFRASLFHLGVIRRLEELGLMAEVDVISAVSGGSIIAAFYLVEMEKRLRRYTLAQRAEPDTRVRLSVEIADSFLDALAHNLRSRALVFTPYYHGWAFVKTLASRPFRATARAELIQREYDRWFYGNQAVEQLPSVQWKKAGTTPPGSLFGPRLIINTTSLLTGQRVAFSREPVSAMVELKGSNANTLKLSRVVGASSGVPGVFPPTSIYGDMLVDGGVSDNQGIEAWFDWLRRDDDERRHLFAPDAPPGAPVIDVVLVSDASGQLERQHTQSTSVASVLGRVSSVFQFQLREKLLDGLDHWRQGDPAHREFAFVHRI